MGAEKHCGGFFIVFGLEVELEVVQGYGSCCACLVVRCKVLFVSFRVRAFRSEEGFLFDGGFILEKPILYWNYSVLWILWV